MNSLEKGWRKVDGAIGAIGGAILLTPMAGPIGFVAGLVLGKKVSDAVNNVVLGKPDR